MNVAAPPVPAAALSIGITGHRGGNLAFATNHEAIAAVLEQVFDIIERATGVDGGSPVRLQSLLADGTDTIASRAALARGWELVAPLPFGRNLNVAINAGPTSVADARALIGGERAQEPAVEARACQIRELMSAARCFELAERDELLKQLFVEKLAAPADLVAAQAFAARCSARAALAGRVMIEQSDIVIGVWDGVSRAFVGGTGHTISKALEHGAPVIWINAKAPANWRILHAPEALAAPPGENRADRETELQDLVTAAMGQGSDLGTATLSKELWRPRSNRWWNGYRRIEVLFAGAGKPFRSLRQVYETPDELASGSAFGALSAIRGLPGGDKSLADAIERGVLRRFAWADGISSYLSDAYRGGMIANFLLSAAAVVAGISYQPLGASDEKWVFALGELLLLSTILLIIWMGARRRWHGRWFETRRVAEYLRHAPILLALGVARAPGRWPAGSDVLWPEFHARHALREIGLPQVAMTPRYLRHALGQLLEPHVASQRDYHEGKARRLTAVHRNLDRFSTLLFQLAVAAVTSYLLIAGAAALQIMPENWPHKSSYLFSFMGVTFPTLGAAIAGIRYFGDFERFAAISEVTAAKLEGVHSRIVLLLEAPDDRLDYARVSELAHATDDIVVSEIENWQAVFAGKRISVPV